MKIFISWSGDQSKAIATNLYEFLKENIQATDPWISSDDIAKGQNWMNDLMLGLQTSQMGIFCLTNSNLEAKWILFEAGVVASLPNRNVCTILYNVKPENVSPPLSHFNSTTFEKEDFRKLLLQINKISKEYSDNKLTDAILNKIIDKNWEHFKEKVSNELDAIGNMESKIRTDTDKIDELINISRSLQKYLIKEKSWYDIDVNGKYYTKCYDGQYKEIKMLDNGKFIMNCFEDEWREVVGHETEITADLVRRVQIALNQNGYKLKTDNVISDETKNALKEFQKVNNLPIGALDFETLKALGIK
jgi:hypothetical protein